MSVNETEQSQSIPQEYENEMNPIKREFKAQISLPCYTELPILSSSDFPPASFAEDTVASPWNIETESLQSISNELQQCYPTQIHQAKYLSTENQEVDKENQ